MDSAAVARVRETARWHPDSRTARTGFADRAVDYPRIPAWILWLYERSPATAQLCYELHYPIGTLPAEYWTRDRAFRAESAARSVERARRFHRDGVAFASTPDLPDDDEFHAAWNAKTDWTGHWYSRDRAEAWGLPEPTTT